MRTVMIGLAIGWLTNREAGDMDVFRLVMGPRSRTFTLRSFEVASILVGAPVQGADDSAP
ncbi:hypothetical protein BMG523Draft_03074 [Frankia sp. BMG5.23]|jgi:hypothetical protein|nr:hypothetical protein BMG523Draft_03074 [Frankia sp. BMG5.23]